MMNRNLWLNPWDLSSPIAVAVLCLMIVSGCEKPKTEISISLHEIESQLDERFPMLTSGFTDPGTPVQAALQVPRVTLDESTQRIVLHSQIQARKEQAPPNEFRGNVTVDAKLDFRVEAGGFYLHDPSVQLGEMGQFPAEYHQPLQEAIEVAVTKYFDEKPLARMPDAAAKPLLQSGLSIEVVITNDRVILK